ncbi:unnamed protein product [Psylliodes chrysocephalus]|uniref:Uncharacterized protein n=1 Tax=Psylliodes chrysocephalus TaxID=3402493 RepID=A0A9P0D4A4_9CUCU|nr:unnamed protein product [Psylliodes chrysocephala]
MWALLDKKSYTTMLDEERPVQGFIKDQRVKINNYIQNVLKDGSHPREDYKELLQLSLLYLGGWFQDEFSFRIPRAMHQASLIYVRFWHEAIVIRWAPKNDLDMLQLLNIYPDGDVKKSTLTIAKRHLWYLSETNVGLAFLDELPNKKEMKRLDDKNLVFKGKDPSHFITSKTKMFLNCLR